MLRKLIRIFTEPLPVKSRSYQPADLERGLRTLADDIARRDDWALDCIGPFSDGLTLEEIAAYPDSFGRQIHIRYLGNTGPGEVPDDEWDRIYDEIQADRQANA